MTFNTEVIVFETSEAFRKNPVIATDGMKLTLQAEGANKPAYYGVQLESPNTAYISIHWDNYEIHKAFGKSPTLPLAHEAFKPSLEGKIEVYDVEFSGPTLAYEQPVTEILILTLKAPENREALVEILTKGQEASGNIVVFGQTHQDENKYIVLGGWPSLEAHRQAAEKPEVAATLKKLFSLANKEHQGHTSWTKYSP